MRRWSGLIVVSWLLAVPLAAANLTLLGQAPGAFTTGLFVHDDLAFFMDIVNDEQILWIYDISAPASPRLLSSTVLWSPSIGIPDMHSVYYSNGLVYAGGLYGGRNFQVLDASDPTSPRIIATVEVPSGTHNLRLAGNYLYVMPNATLEADVIVYDVSDPAAPTEINQFTALPSTSFCHDISIMDGVGYASMWELGVFLLDLTDPRASPLPVLNRHPETRPGYLRATHSVWLLPDRQHVLTCHESVNRGMNLFDTTANPLGTSPWNYQSHDTSPDTVIHDVFAVGRYAYIAYYEEGVRVLDLLDPLNPVEVASYALPNSAFAIWVEEGTVYALDRRNGLFILDFTLPHPAPITLFAVKSGAARDAVSMEWNYTGESQYTVRRSTNKTALGGPRPRDVDGATRWTDAGIVPDGNTYYYKINGPWQ